MGLLPGKPSVPAKRQGFPRCLRRINLLFLFLLCYACLVPFLAIVQHRIPIGHDGFYYLSLQYYFLNNAVFSGEVAAWIPYITHGLISSWWYFIQAGILQNILLLIAPLLRHINFLPLFYLGILLDKLLLLTGTWLLAKRLFRNDVTAFFVSFTVSASTIWTTQPWFNFHFLYAVPMILYLVHAFLDTRQWRYALLAGGLLVLQTFGNSPYLISMTTFTIVLYLACFLLFNREALKGLPLWSWQAAACCAFVLAGFALTYYTLSHGTGAIVNYGIGRDRHMHTTFNSFLHYGGSVNARKWLELLLGISPVYDYTLFIGLLPLTLIVPGLYYACADKRHRPLLIVTVVLLAAASGYIPVLYLMYHLWPMMSYFRHIALIAPLVRLFLCFVAGSAFDKIFMEHPRSKTAIGFVLFMVLLLLGDIVLLRFLTHHPHQSTALVDWMLTWSTTRLPFIPIPEKMLVPIFSEVMFGAAQLLFLLAVYLVLRGYKNRHVLFITVILLAHLLDLSLYDFQNYRLRTMPLNARMTSELNFSPPPYRQRRTKTSPPTLPRQDIIAHLFDSGAFYWFYSAFVSSDQLGTRFRTDYWMRPLDKYLRAYWGQNIDDITKRPRGWYPYSPLIFPWNRLPALKISGAAEDKIQFFSKAFTASDDKAASLMTDPHYHGDILFVAPRRVSGPPVPVTAWKGGVPLDADLRLHLPYTVTRFSANEIRLRVRVPGNRPVLLMYADVWHPFWKARVNGVARPVFRADLAYKAVVLGPGVNDVEFSFDPRSIAWTSVILGGISLFGLVLLLLLTARLVCDKNAYSPIV